MENSKTTSNKTKQSKTPKTKPPKTKNKKLFILNRSQSKNIKLWLMKKGHGFRKKRLIFKIQTTVAVKLAWKQLIIA